MTTGTQLEQGVAAVLAAAAALPEEEHLSEELRMMDEASERGYFLPDEEERIRMHYGQYLGMRAALLDTLAGLAGEAGWKPRGQWEERLPVFAAAFAAACVLMRVDRFVVELADGRAVVWKKLDEPDEEAGVPRKSFTRIYRAMSNPVSNRRFLAAADFYFAHREEIAALTGDPVAGAVVDLLRVEEPWIGRRRRDAVKRQMSYRWFSFLRRNRSAWNQVMFGLFEASGRAVADLRQPGIKAAGAPKRITAELREEVLGKAGPGDVFVTRHDDALSNLFLPGFWPHAALYLGTTEQLRALEVGLPPEFGDGRWFLESKKDGVRIRPVEETLAVDALVVMRPPLAANDLGEALRRALGHVGKPYDFLFDFRTGDRLVCTEVVYRGYHGLGTVKFHLREVGGRLCLPAEEFLNQAMDCGFKVRATAGLRGERVLSGMPAELAFHASRQPV